MQLFLVFLLLRFVFSVPHISVERMYGRLLSPGFAQFDFHNFFFCTALERQAQLVARL